MTPSPLLTPFVRRILVFSVLLALAGGWLMGRLTAPVLGLEVSFRNVSDVTIESIQLDFGSADTQSSICLLYTSPSPRD